MKKKKNDVYFLKESLCNVFNVICQIRVLNIAIDMFKDNISLCSECRETLKTLTGKVMEDLSFLLED